MIVRKRLTLLLPGLYQGNGTALPRVLPLSVPSGSVAVLSADRLILGYGSALL